MEIEQVIAISLGAVALALALVSIVLTLRREEGDRARAFRQDLSRIIQELSSARAEEQSLVRSGATEHEGVHLQRWQLLWQRMDLLVRRATCLVSARPQLATDIDYVILAQALHLSRMWDRAERAWQEAVERAPSPDYRALNLRGYAEFLFATDRKEEGRKAYRKALGSLPSNTDSNRYVNGYTYQLWMQLEYSDVGRMDECYMQAQREFRSMSNARLRAEALEYLQRSYEQMLIARAKSDPGAQQAINA